MGYGCADRGEPVSPLISGRRRGIHQDPPDAGPYFSAGYPYKKPFKLETLSRGFFDFSRLSRSAIIIAHI